MIAAQRGEGVGDGFLLSVDFDGDVRAADAAADGALAAQAHAGQAERIHLGDEAVAIGREFEQRGHEHVAGRTHIAFEVERFHP